MRKAVFYGSVGPELSLYDIDVEAGTLTRRGTVSTPGANVQYVWPNPSRTFLYVASSDGGPGKSRNTGTRHIVSAFRMDETGALTPHGGTVALPSRPVHCSLDATGRDLLTAYNNPSNVTVHRINGDGTLGDPVPQPKLDVGIFAHQILTTPGNRTAVLVTRGNHAEDGKPEDPGALKVFAFQDGRLSGLASIAPGNGLGFGPRHVDFHPTRPWMFVSVERQSQLFVYEIGPDGSVSRDPIHTASTLIDRANDTHAQMAGAIHVHPNGRFLYVTNRNSSTEDVGGKPVFKGGENNIAVFAIDPASGKPTRIQNAETPTIHLRTFAIDPSGRLLIASSILPMALRDGSTLPAAQVVYRIGGDGRLTFVRKYDVDTGAFMQFWTGIVAPA